MSSRDDGTASRIAVLEQELVDRDEQLAEARQLLQERERQILSLRRQLERVRGREELPPPRSPAGPRLDPAKAQAEADRFLIEGIRMHRAGESKEATRLFRRGLALVPGHADLLRALRLYA